MRSFASPRAQSDFDISRRPVEEQEAVARFGRRTPVSRITSGVQAPRTNSVDRGLDGWTIFLLGALVAGLMGMMLGGALSV